MPTHPSAVDKTRAKNRRLLIVILVFGLAATGAVIMFVFAILLVMSERVKESNRVAAAVDRATAGQEGERWTLNELFSYLKAKGAVSSMRVVESGRDSRPAEWIFETADTRTVRVRKLADAAAAATDARASGQNPGFSWGRFSFVGDPVANERFRQFLQE
jgi:hypothetical protein